MGISPRTLRPSSTFSPRSISGLALWLDASSSDLYTTDAGPVVAVASPLDIAGCQLWLDASDASKITSSSGVVSQWTDKSATGSTWTVTSGDGGPSTGTATINGKNVLVFDGTNDSLSASAPLNTSNPLTMFVVQRISTATLAGMTYAAGTGDNFNVRQAGSTSGFLEIIAGGGRVFLGSANRTGINDIVSVTFPSATDASLYVQGLVQSPLTNAALKPTLTGTHYIGKRSDGFYLNGQIAEIIAYNTALTPTDRARVESYLAAKWAISGVHTPATASSDPVGYWGDKSGNGRHVTTSDASTRPVIHSATHNGRKVLDFDGVNDTLSRDNYTAENDLTGLTRFGVFYVDSGAGPFHLSSVYNGGSYSSFTSASNLLNTHAGLSNSSQHANVSNILPTGTNPRVFCARYDGTAGSFATGLNIIMDGVTLPVASTAGTFPSSLPGGSPSLFIGSNIRANNWLNGKLCEYISYTRALTTAERQRVERYLASRWGITLAPQVANADAQDWINRVYANGGSVSAATAGAVNTFCESIASAGIRDRFYRLGIFAGSNLNAALVPLYRGPSLGGTQYGNATDTNVGPFVSGDFSESSGLKGDGTTKSLDTGLVQNTFSLSSLHAAVSFTELEASSDRYPITNNGLSANNFVTLQSQASFVAYCCSFDTANGTRTTAESHLMMSRSTNSLLTLYSGGSSVGTQTATVSPGTAATTWRLFMRQDAVNAVGRTAMRLRFYSIGTAVDGAAATAFANAVAALNTALGR